LHSSCTAFEQAVGTAFSDQVTFQAIGAVGSDCIAEQWIGFGRGYGVTEQWIGFSGSEGIQCKNRESDTEDSLAFHDGVLRGAVVGNGTDLTPHRGYENFIDLMVVIDAINSWSSMSHHRADIRDIAYVSKRNALQSRKA
jgi:hypothetical protein